MSRILIFTLAVVLSTPVAAPQVHTAPAAPPATLTAIDGEAFDRAFVAHMIQANLDAAEELRNRMAKAAHR